MSMRAAATPFVRRTGTALAVNRTRHTISTCSSKTVNTHRSATTHLRVAAKTYEHNTYTTSLETKFKNARKVLFLQPFTQ